MSVVPRVLVAHSDIPTPAIDLLKQRFDVEVIDSKSADDVLKVVSEFDAVMGKIHIDAKFLDNAGNRLRVVSTPSAGYDHMDVVEIKKRGIKVGNAPQVLSAAVAEIAVFLLLGAVRRAHEGRLLLDRGEVVKGFQFMLGHDLRNKTVGIVGFGSIGEAIAKRLVPFEVKKFLYCGHSKKKAGDQIGADFVSLDKLLQESDIVINCVPLNEETENMFDDEVFKKMKSTAVFVNVGRGRTVDTDALVRALKNKTIYAAGLDVTEPEPLPVDHELLKLENVVLLPHMGSQTIETRTDMAIAAAENIINALEGKPMRFEL
ncbi:glyoxylate reductase/hydroxypyruvate reductase [Copidosoma floridanum]|uniref:glyoxylate reductase/hydroxypyruvate reductase n=1 Tax=Copidosoma floridanum TaxID=29053 RepID=UPI0006C9B5FB|nr:glyoxylate reductase/hydroxypyruvate reductase [Copidosoma floridanum]